MAYLNMTMFSSTLHMDTDLCVFLPEDRTGRREPLDPDRKYPVLYLLHGMRENQTCWPRKSIVELVARERDTVVVCPTTGVGFYANQKHGQAWLDYIAEELPVRMANYFPISTKREDTFIAGNSMGGYGALRAALSHPELYGGAASFSGALQAYEEHRVPGEPVEGPAANDPFMDEQRLNTFGTLDEYLASDDNLVNLARKVVEGEGPAPKLFLCCGTDDFLTYGMFKAFCKKVDPIGLEYTSSEAPGGHNFGYWNQMIEPMFDFFGLEKNQAYARIWA